MGLCIGFTTNTNMLGCPGMGKYGVEFSGRHMLMVDACLEKCRQFPLSELVCIEDVPQETQWGLLGKLHLVTGCALVQLEHHLGFSHCSHMCPYSRHLLQ